MHPLMRGGREAARRRGLAVLAIGLLTFALSALVTAIRLPLPQFHDEFSYLLAADTFSRGRLANPPHPMWVHFETFHVLQQPTYASKYPPAQGLFLALGQRLGHPIVGVWLTGALAAAACCWMLQGWVPARFALLGGVLVAFHHGLRFYWNDYWNGSPAMLGGALLFGALPRLRRRPRAGPALALAVGVALLANSRPFFGLLACLPVAVVLCARTFGRGRPPLAISLRRLVAPAGSVLLLTAAGMAFYNARVTGDPLTLPYQLHNATYAYTPQFLWQKPAPPPAYRHAVMRDFYLGWQAEAYRAQQSIWEAFKRKRETLYFFVTPLLVVPLVTLPWLLRSRKTRFAAGTVLLLFGASLGVSGTHPHYLAPVACLLFLLVVNGLRQVDLWSWRGRAWGRRLVLAVVALEIAAFFVGLGLYAREAPPAWVGERARVLGELEAMPGKHLVIVRYEPGHSPHEEWVHNGADIDGAKIVWARAMDDAADRRLEEYFADRRLWRLDPDRKPPQLVPEPRPSGAGDAASGAAPG